MTLAMADGFDLVLGLCLLAVVLGVLALGAWRHG